MAVSEIKRPLSNSIGSDTVTNTQRGIMHVVPEMLPDLGDYFVTAT